MTPSFKYSCWYNKFSDGKQPFGEVTLFSGQIENKEAEIFGITLLKVTEVVLTPLSRRVPCLYTVLLLFLHGFDQILIICIIILSCILEGRALLSPTSYLPPLGSRW